MRQVFDVHKFLARAVERDYNVDHLSTWCLDCQGKTEEEIRELGYGTSDSWHVPEIVHRHVTEREFQELIRTYTQRKYSYYVSLSGEMIIFKGNRIVATIQDCVYEDNGEQNPNNLDLFREVIDAYDKTHSL